MRLFIAIDLPEDLRAALAGEQDRFRALSAGTRDIRWTVPESLHLTLKFLGEVSPDRVPAVTAVLESIGPFTAFEIEVRGFGFFPDARRPSVFWAGLNAPANLDYLARKVDQALAALGFPREKRPFTPHLTLARFRAPRADPALVRQANGLEHSTVGRFAVSEYFLYESRLLPGGAKHTKVARFS